MKNSSKLQAADMSPEVPPVHYLDSVNDDNYDIEAEITFDLEEANKLLDRQLQELAHDPCKPQRGKGPTVHVGFDSEFISGDEHADTQVLSLQFYLMCGGRTFQRVVYPSSRDKLDRPKFSKLIVCLINDAMEEGVVKEWPNQVVVSGFFLRIDLQAFGDLVTFKSGLDNVGGKVASVKSSIYVISPDNNQVLRSLKVRFIDVGGHVAMGTNLAQIGDLLDLPKLDLPEGYTKNRMDLLLEGDKQAFEEYGLRDAEIAVKFYLRLQGYAEKVTGSSSLPATASSLAVKIFKKLLKEQAVDFNQAFGVTESSSTFWSDTRKGVLTAKTVQPTPMRAVNESFISSCYSGGRNECYSFGPTEIGVYNDFDLVGAYTTGMVDLRHIDYDHFKVTHDPADFVGHVLGFAYVRFNFPQGTRFPSLPVRNKDNGLIYPLTGFSYCTAPEIEVALNLGCEIEIKHGVVIPWMEGDDRLFEPYVRWVREERKLHDEGSLDETYAKLLGNSLYGKTAQGLKKKSVFESRTMESVELPPSSITNAAIAAHTTGFIRAVLSELIAAIPEHRKVVSATTDGFITDADAGELKLNGVMSKRYMSLCERFPPLDDKPVKMLKLKHCAKQLIALKTRGQLTAMPFEGETIILAKAGVSPQVDKEQHCDFMVDLFLNRKPGDKTVTKPFTPFREQWVKDADVVRLTRETTLNIEYDMKRRLVNPRTIAVAGGAHVALDSVPWQSLEECERARAIFTGWRETHCLKTVDECEEWEDHYQFSLVRDRLPKGTVVRATTNGVADVLRRLFLRAYTQGLCGLTKEKTYTELADWLTLQGYPTTVDEIKNAKRAKFVEHAVPATRRVMELARVLEQGFPSIEINQFIQSI